MQGVAQVVHRLMDLWWAVVATQRALADIQAHAHTVQGNGLLAQEETTGVGDCVALFSAIGVAADQLALFKKGQGGVDHAGAGAVGAFEQAQVGQHLYIGGPRGSMIVPDIFDSYLLIGDETAIPAIARRLEELPAGRKVLAVIEIADAAEQQALNSAAEVEVIWVLRGQDELLDVVRNLTLPSGTLYSFVATETKLSRQVRRVLLDAHKVNEQYLKAVGYWRAEGSEEE